MQPVLQIVLIVKLYESETFELRVEAGMLSCQVRWTGRKVKYITVVVNYFISFIIYLFCVYFLLILLCILTAPLFQVMDRYENKSIIIIVIIISRSSSIIIFGQRHPVLLVNQYQSKPHKHNAQTLYVVL
jgi:hypothetical protein